MNIAVAAAALLLVSGCGEPSSATAALGAPSGGEKATITRIVDGDTAEAEGRGGARLKIRIRGINTPETVAPGRPIECGGPQATQYAKDHLLGKRVTLVTDAGDLRDHYGRLVAEVWPGARSYAEQITAAGWARANTFKPKHPATDRGKIEAAERGARAARRGMWGLCGG